jgi:hypothetical protein
MQADATPGSPRCRGRLPGKRPGGPVATKQVLFADPLVSPPSLPRAPPSNGPGTVFLVVEPFFWSRTSFCMPWTGGVIPASTAAVPAPSAVTASEIWTSDLSSIWPRLELRGEPCGDLATSLVDGQTSWMYCTTLIHSLYISCNVFSNKLVL